MLDPGWTPERGYSHAANLLAALERGETMPLTMENRQKRGLALEPTAQPLMGSQEVAQFLGVSRQAISQAVRKRGMSRRGPKSRMIGFPKPTAHLHCGPVWRTSTIIKYAEKRAVTTGNR